jgi:hypothetical protein
VGIHGCENIGRQHIQALEQVVAERGRTCRRAASPHQVSFDLELLIGRQVDFGAEGLIAG